MYIPGIRSVFLAALVLTLGALAGPGALAWGEKPIQDMNDTPVPDGMDLSTIEDAIIDGCAQRNWVAERVEKGHMTCTLYIRTHMAKVNIEFDTENFSITYADSENLDYDAEKREIHRNYNSWVQNLNGDIRNALLRASR